MSLVKQKISSTRIPTFDRFKRFTRITREISLTRALQYEHLKDQAINDPILDVGGGAFTSYIPILEGKRIDSINIDSDANPTWVVDPGQEFPCKKRNYNSVISMNTIEHVFNVAFVFDEIFKALKKGGQAFLSVPFLFPLHGSPDDFFRPTPSWFFQSLSQAGFTEIEVTPLSWGPFSTGLTASGTPGPGKRLRRQIALFTDLAYVNLRKHRQSESIVEDVLLRHALGFFVKAIK